MSQEYLEIYLNDHLAGSVAALELLEHLELAFRDTGVGRFAAELRVDVEQDREELEALMLELGIAESSSRKVTAWLTERVTELKLRWDDGEGALRLLEAFEALSVGIEGKRLLWLALEFAAEEAPALQLPNYDKLIQRAKEQRARAEVMRLKAARVALSADAEVD